jgi:hypothetical protein
MEYNEMIKIGVSERQALDFSQAWLKEWANSLTNRTRTLGKSDDEIIAMMKDDLRRSKY